MRIKDVQYKNDHLLVSAYLLLNKYFFNAVSNAGTLTLFLILVGMEFQRFGPW